MRNMRAIQQVTIATPSAVLATVLLTVREPRISLEEIATRARVLPAKWIFRNHERMEPGPLPAGPWTWVPYEVGDPALARSLMARGATWLETMAIAGLAEAFGGVGPDE
jgi:hypothetical protein